jgi:protein-S-isoprenylcysteine O-methyltransferase Ste14
MIQIERPVAAAAFVTALIARHAAQLWLAGRAPGAPHAPTPETADTDHDVRRSGWTSTALLFLCYVSAMGLAVVEVARGASPWAALGVGGALWSCAVAIRMWALAHLREQFSALIEIRPAHRLVRSGPYGIARHPLHVAFGLEVTAFAGAAWSWWAIPPAALVWIVILVRNRTEERALAAHFGGEYDAYRARVPAMNVVRGLARRFVGRRRLRDP